MFTAGTDTSSIIVEWAMAEMLKNPGVMARAQEELERVVGRGRRLEESDLGGLPYLQAVCKEAMRLHPSTPLSLPHFSFDACDAEVDVDDIAAVGGGVEDAYGEDRATEGQPVTPWTLALARFVSTLSSLDRPEFLQAPQAFFGGDGI